LSKELDTVDYYEQQNKVVGMRLKGTQPRAIAKLMGLKLVEVEKHIDEWQNVAKNSKHIQERAGEALSATDQHYDLIINELWSVIDEANIQGDLKVKASTLKVVADIEKSRIEMLQKSGLLDNQQLADQVLEAERKQEILVKILRQLAQEYPEAAQYVRKELSKVTGMAESTVVQGVPD